MYDFILKNAYGGSRGIAGISVSVIAFLLYLSGFAKQDTMLQSILIFLAALVVLNPMYLYYRAIKQVKLNPSFKEPLNYSVDEMGITVGQGTETGTIPWEAVASVIETKKNVFIYLSKRNAYLFPKEQLKEQYNVFKQMIREHVDPIRCRKLK